MNSACSVTWGKTSGLAERGDTSGLAQRAGLAEAVLGSNPAELVTADMVAGDDNVGAQVSDGQVFLLDVGDLAQMDDGLVQIELETGDSRAPDRSGSASSRSDPRAPRGSANRISVQSLTRRSHHRTQWRSHRLYNSRQ